MMNLLKRLLGSVPEYRVFIRWDEEAKVYWAQSEDIPGLATEAETIDALIKRIIQVTPELLRDNQHSFIEKDSHRCVPLNIIAECKELAPLCAA